MKNSRPIEVGQVRQVTDEREVSFGKLYRVGNITETGYGYSFCEVTFLEGELKGTTQEWDIKAVKEDIVVM